MICFLGRESSVVGLNKTFRKVGETPAEEFMVCSCGEAVFTVRKVLKFKTWLLSWWQQQNQISSLKVCKFQISSF